ncbi:FAD:protein FMN transferase [Elizabethkingia meningoseptica]|uniref:FAD:protein FMN transferase n=1 Tax=Elizabethkingia meningoseptica TaxID=238 RepID=UPI0023B1DC09|nr:FAD:protein FMN transferase [Elizabethkingia meningoseptica]MDE5438358.1 FAD:protein FMN transferase [Elizabethkingia meningoseptica]MDE5509881.1 FAD:protein FMN transferase [Elizabethkingia meningoseptica]MDE5517247.1 FAD:protein FMN transferase [Elizabethkingia meningoseptica]MDE5527798.1 FAD:protein FMN transferase [Elizabethkingia meningoseptica]MDE5530057.1 FAD:protein FMN transferase [Elizabethkingia meningoseptica]
MNRTHLFIKTILLLCTVSISAQVQRTRLVTLMGSRFQITLVDKDSLSAEKNIDKAIDEITRIENLISEWRPETQISQVNKNAGIQPVKVDPEVFKLTQKALYFSEITDGAFDISIVAMDKIWKFDDSMNELPGEQAIKESVRNVGYHNIVLDSTNSTIFLKKQGMKIGFGSIGKGYAADQARELMKSYGVKAGIIDASGDISTWGTQPDGKPWAIGINNPFNSHKMAAILYFTENSVTTSGSYEKYAEINGKRYSHIMNPKTGYPSTGLTSVTVTGPNATMANGFSTSIMVLGEKDGLKLIKKFPEYHYLFITDKGKIIKDLKYKPLRH